MDIYVVSNHFNSEYLYSMCENEIVKELYNQYSNEIKKVYFKDSEYSNERKYYVYGWYANTEPKKYFYIGKGTKSRYGHILNDIKQFETNRKKLSNIKADRIEKYAMIKNWWGIDCDFLLKDLNEAESVLYEKLIKIDYAKHGHFILDYEDTGTIVTAEELQTIKAGIEESGIEYWTPIIIDSPFHAHYDPDYKNNFYDDPETEYLKKITIEDNETSNVYDSVREWVKSKGGRVYKTIGKNTKSILVTRKWSYEQYTKYHNQGIRYYSLSDVLGFIKDH